MGSRRMSPPWDYLHEASAPSLESFELSRLNHAANTRKEIAVLLDQYLDDMAQAMLARWVREDRALLQSSSPAPRTAPQSVLDESAAPDAAKPMRAERSGKVSRRGTRLPFAS